MLDDVCKGDLVELTRLCGLKKRKLKAKHTSNPMRTRSLSYTTVQNSFTTRISVCLRISKIEKHTSNRPSDEPDAESQQMLFREK